MRKVRNKPLNIKCRICGKFFSAYGISSHILHAHSIEINEYVNTHGEFRKNRAKPKRSIQKIKCKICQREIATVGMFVHLRDTHNISVQDYKEKYGEYNKRYMDYNERAEKNKIKCLICGQLLGSERLLSYHIKLHSISKIEYIKKYIFYNKKQLCECGCGKEVTLKNQYPYRQEFISGHNSRFNNPMKDKIHNEESLRLMRKKAIKRAGKTNKSNTIGERKFKDFLESVNVKYTHQYKTNYGVIDFYIPDYNLFVEIDGVFWHKNKKEKLNFQQLATLNSEYEKRKIPNLIRIYDNHLCKIKSMNDLYNIKRSMDFNITYNQKILSKDYLTDYKKYKGEQKLKDKTYLLLKFIRNYHNEFPYPPQEEDLGNIINKISTYDFSRIYSGDVFRNNISSVGVNYLKSKFKSYWNSKYKNSYTPIEAWHNDKIMRKIIHYRIGLNNSNEVYDFSLHQLIRGISARRYSISFFKPLLAAAIYKKFIDKPDPVVIDPCAGFGGRLLGFKSVFPAGKYIGIEPNPETFNELQNLADNFNNVEIYNCKLEDYSGRRDADLAFTSIPYFDKEIYSNHVSYTSFNEWKNTFIRGILQYNNLLVNVSPDLEFLFDYKKKYYIKSNTDHFDTENNIKYESLLDVNIGI